MAIPIREESQSGSETMEEMDELYELVKEINAKAKAKGLLFKFEMNNFELIPISGCYSAVADAVCHMTIAHERK